MKTLRTLIAPAMIAAGVSFMPAQASAEANFDSVKVTALAAKFVDAQGWLSWKATVVNMTNETAYFNLIVRVLDTAGFELTRSGVLFQSIKPYSLGSYSESFNVIARYLSQFGSVQISVEKDDYHTLTAPKTTPMTRAQELKAMEELSNALMNLGKK